MLSGREVAAEENPFRASLDPFGRRVEKVAGSVTTTWLYDGDDILQETINPGPSEVKYQYIHGPGIDEPLARIENPGPSEVLTYYHADGLGSVIATTSQAGAIVSTRRYDAWGNLEVGAETPGYAFTGREWDPETGLYYYRARYYDPKVGRFLSEDPIRFSAGVNFYAYVSGNPASLVDPLGLWTTGIHEYLIDQAFPGLTAAERGILKRSSSDADAMLPGQLGSMSHTHAMSEAGEDRQAAALKWSRFLKEQQQRARDLVCGKEWTDWKDSLYALGRGMHALADSTSPSHRGFQPWVLTDLPAHHEAENKIGIDDYRNTISLLRSYYQTTYGVTAW